MRLIPAFAGAKIRRLEVALKEHCQHPHELHRAGIESRLYPTDRQLAAYRQKSNGHIVRADHELQGNQLKLLNR